MKKSNENKHLKLIRAICLGTKDRLLISFLSIRTLWRGPRYKSKRVGRGWPSRCGGGAVSWENIEKRQKKRNSVEKEARRKIKKIKEMENWWPAAEVKRWRRRMKAKSWQEKKKKGEALGKMKNCENENERKWLDKFINEQQLSEHKRDIEKWKTSKSFNCFASNTTKWIVNKTKISFHFY